MEPVGDIDRLIAGGESYTVEFKRARTPQDLNDRELVEAVTCMANGAGGDLLLGVEDDGQPTGAGARHGAHTDADRLAALVLNRTDPPLPCRVAVLDVGDNEVIHIQVPRAMSPVGTKDGMFKRRSTKVDGTPECVPYKAHEMQTASFMSLGRDYAEVEAPGVELRDLDPVEFARFRSLAGRSGHDAALSKASDEEICRALRVLGTDQNERTYLSIGAVLLFGTPELIARKVPSAEVLFQEMDARGAIVESQSGHVPLLKASEEIEHWLRIRNPEQEVMVGLLRVSIRRIPPAVVREAVANALVHRDYAELGPLTVQLTPDQFAVHSPGGLPAGVTLDNLLEQSRPRSVVLADAFKRAGIVDRTGRGVPQMFDSLLRTGRGEPDYSRTTEATVTVATSTSEADLDMVRFVLAWEDEGQSPLSLSQLRILHDLKAGGPASVSELAAELGLRTATLRIECVHLTEVGLAEAHGRGRGRQYRLSSAFYRAADDRNAYIRVRAADPIQQDQMVLRYVEEYGAITRSQVVDLCLVDVSQARTILKRLVGGGRLNMRGAKRGAHYVMASKGEGG